RTRWAGWFSWWAPPTPASRRRPRTGCTSSRLPRRPKTPARRPRQWSGRPRQSLLRHQRRSRRRAPLPRPSRRPWRTTPSGKLLHAPRPRRSRSPASGPPRRVGVGCAVRAILFLGDATVKGSHVGRLERERMALALAGVALLSVFPAVQRSAAQDSSAVDRGVRIGIIYRPGVRPGLVV